MTNNNCPSAPRPPRVSPDDYRALVHAAHDAHALLPNSR